MDVISPWNRFKHRRSRKKNCCVISFRKKIREVGGDPLIQKKKSMNFLNTTFLLGSSNLFSASGLLIHGRKKDNASSPSNIIIDNLIIDMITDY